jgi:hypothetical protein
MSEYLGTKINPDHFYLTSKGENGNDYFFVANRDRNKKLNVGWSLMKNYKFTLTTDELSCSIITGDLDVITRLEELPR